MNQLQTQIFDPNVRQLLFSIFGQDLITIHPSPIHLNDDYRAFFIALEANPQNLHNFLQQYQHVLLGGLFEALWQFFLTHAPGWQLLAHNVQIKDAVRTLGELDVLAKHATRGTYHFELAVKFYLLTSTVNIHDLHHWLGPNARDNLELKLQRLQHHQLPMLYRNESQAQLNHLQLPAIKQQNIILKGNLLLPANSDTEFKLPNTLTSTQGYWLHASQAPSVLHSKSSWVVLSKPQWLCPFVMPVTDTKITVHKTQEIIELIATSKARDVFKAILIAEVRLLMGVWEEQQRYMIVADDWPATAKN